MVNASAHFVPQLVGAGASAKAGEKAKGLGITKAIVITDKGVKDAGIVDPIVKNIRDAGIECIIFDGVKPDPPDVVCDAAGELAIKEKINGIIAIGGGSSIDTAKAVNTLMQNPPPINQWLLPAQVQGDPLPIIAIPTSAGTGSEATYVAVITDTKLGSKRALAGKFCYAALSIIDPELYVGMPPSGTAYCAFDTYTHAVDTICHANPETFATIYAEKAISMVHEHLIPAMENGKDLVAREGLAVAATLGGLAINGAMCHLTHKVGHTLGATFHLAHGLCCAICLPQLVRFYAEVTPDLMFTAARAMGLNPAKGISSEKLGKMASDHVLKFMKAAKLPTLKELGIKLDDVLALVPVMQADSTGRPGVAPQQLTDAQLTAMLTEAYDL